MNKNTIRAIFIFASMGIAIGILILFSFFYRGNTGAQIWAYSFFALYILYALYERDTLVDRFLLFAFFAGLAELVADAWAVHITGTLHYPNNQPMLWYSPFYMPFSWTVVFIQIGFIGFLIAEKLKMIWACLIMIVLGACLVPFYEHFAIAANWWYYDQTKMIWTVPYYIIIAEGLLMASIPPFYKKCQTMPIIYIPLLGIIQGLLVLVCGVIAYYLL